MELINAGFLSILPPIIAIGLALITKEVISSLMIGVLSGTLIYAYLTDGGFIKAIETTFTLMADKIGSNASIILFLALLGALVVVINKAGGSRAYGEWAASKIKTRTGAQLFTSLLGALIFIDDYFNCLTVGTVMKPVTDKHKISREKLAYLIDATAAPICIIAPISSWAAAIISQISETGIAEPMKVFMSTIPFNLYAILTFVMIISLSVSNLDFGKMAKYEQKALEGEISIADTRKNQEQIGTKGTVMDLIVPIAALILFSILAMLMTGGYFDGSGMSLAEAFGNTDASISLVYGGFAALVVALLLYLPRSVLSFRDFMESITEGVQSMTGAIIILTLAWTISGVCRDLLGTGEYVGEVVRNSTLSMTFIPAIIFVVAAFLSFSMGTAWGTFGILIPIVHSIIGGASMELLIIAFSATFAGSVFGDHCSPISDTTILSSTGADCPHINHVSTQIPYAMVVAACCFVGYIVAGLTIPMGMMVSALLTIGISLLLLAGALVVLHKLSSSKVSS